jgi:hypothetical protein
MTRWDLTLDDEGLRPRGRPLLALSDIRGDLAALETVLDEVADIDLCGIVAAGDHCLGGPAPFEVWQRLNALGVTLVRGVSDLALGVIAAEAVTPDDEEQERRVREFMHTREQLGDIICRRLAELPSTAVVSLDDRTGVMVLHGSPRDEHKGLRPDIDDEALAEATSCVAEDVLVTGCTTAAFERQLPGLLYVHAGSVSRNPVTTASGRRTAHAVLLQTFSDGSVHAFPRDIEVRSQAAPDDHAVARRTAS